LVDTEVDGCRYLLIRMPRPEVTNVRLSPREQEIVRMVAKGHPNAVPRAPLGSALGWYE